MYQIIQYLKFRLTATNQHGVHSPFVFDLVTKCLYDKNHHKAYDAIKAFRADLLSSKETIRVTDLGAGSKQMKTTQRRVAQMVKTSGTTLKRAQLMFRLVHYLQPKHLLEMGTSLGIATHAMAMGNPEAVVISIEGCTNCSEMARQQLNRFEITNVQLKTGPFEDYLSELSTTQWDFVFFDGNHKKEATLQYFEQLLPTVGNDTLFIFDDIYWSKGMTEAWEQIKRHPKVTVTIDTFFWGLLFFRSGQAKENFKIRM